MKLPEFKSTTSASMGSAMMTPQLRPMTVAHRAAQHNVMAGQDSVEAASKNAMAKYGVGLAVAEGVGAVVEMYGKIDLANQTGAEELASAQYSQHMSDFSAREVLTGGQIDQETGVSRHYGSAERYNAESERYIEELLSTNKFSNSSLQRKFRMGVAATDHTSNKSMTSSGYKHQIEEAKGTMMEARFNTASYAKKIDITNRMVDLDLITDSQGEIDNDKFRTEQRVESFYAGVRADPTGINSVKDLETLNSGDAIKTFGGIQNVNRMRTLVLDNKANLIASNIFQKVDVTKSKETLRRELADVMNWDYEKLGVTNESEKQVILGKLKTEMNDRFAVMSGNDAKALKDQLYGNDVNSFNEAISKGDTKYTKHLPGAQGSFERMNKEAFQDNNESMMDVMDSAWGNYQNIIMAKFGVIDKVWMTELEEALRVGTPELKIRAANQIQALIGNPDLDLSEVQLQKALGKELMGDAAAIFADNSVAQDEADRSKMSPSQQTSNRELADTMIRNGNKSTDGISQNQSDIMAIFKDPSWFGYEIDSDTASFMESEYRNKIEELAVNGKYHGNPSNIKTAAASYIKANYAVEVRQDGSIEVVKGSFFKDAGTSDGKPTENAMRVINSELLRSGNEQFINNETAEAVPRQIKEGVYQLFHRGTKDGVKGEWPILGDDGWPLVISSKELEDMDLADQQRIEGSVNGETHINRMFSTLTEGSKTSQNREAFIRAIYPPLSKAADVVLERADAVMNMYIDSLSDMVTLSPETAKQLDINIYDATGGFLINPSDEANEILWNRMLERAKAGIAETNARNPGSIDDKMETSMLNDYKLTLIERFGLTPPEPRVLQ